MRRMRVSFVVALRIQTSIALAFYAMPVITHEASASTGGLGPTGTGATG